LINYNTGIKRLTGGIFLFRPMRAINIPLPANGAQKASIAHDIINDLPFQWPTVMSDFSAAQEERDRIAALKQYEILDTGAEEAFDDITRLASLICETPVSLLNFIDETRQWTKAGTGIDTDLTELPRELVFCNKTILHDNLYQISDTTKDTLFANNPLVTTGHKVRFYAGVPLVNPEGYRLGALCVIDMKPKILSQTQKDSLESLANIAVALLEAKRTKVRLNLLSQVYETVDCNIFLFDQRTWVCEYANASALGNTQMSAEEILKCQITDLFTGISEAALHEMVNMIDKNELPFFYQNSTLTTKTKKIIPVNFYLTLRKATKNLEIIVATINNQTAEIHLPAHTATAKIAFENQANHQKTENLNATQRQLEQALSDNQFLVYYQPIKNIGENAITSCEALLRWRDGEGKISLPTNFIKVAEQSGLIKEIGEWVIREVANQIAYWKKNSVATVPIAINISALQFKQENFVNMIGDILQSKHLTSQDISLELTESAIVQDYSLVSSKMEELREAGFKFSLDDFGTGYSSLSYLTKFPLDKIKIDKSFVADLTSNASSAAIIKAIITLAKNLKLSVVAEGVETTDQLKFLDKYLCDEIQGYLLSKPINSLELENDFLRQPRLNGQNS
jgi:EAL domain-containing protein (putative c-di-GMP-specific phosphodiesterase class I)